jgi:biopolymer transport protein ExbB
LAIVIFSGSAQAWWNNEWSARTLFTVDTSSSGEAISDPIGTVAVLVRLHDGNFQFVAGKEDGSDLRFVAADDKTLLPHHVERYDAVLNEAFVWVKLPDLKGSTQTTFWLYHGNLGEKATRTDDSKATYDAETVLVYHFSENGTPPADYSAGGNKADKAGAPATTAIIGGGLRLTGQNAVTVPASASLAWKEGAAVTWSAWIKPSAFHADAVLFSRREGDNAFVIGENQGVPFVELSNAGTTQRTPQGEPLAANVWRHLAVVAEAGKLALYLNGELYGSLDAGLPALNSPLLLGKDAADAQSASFTGELDELQISKVARPAGYLKLSALSQSGSESAAKIVRAGKEEAGAHAGGGELMEHLSLFSEISKSLTFDGWVVIGLCSILAIVGWGVALSKFFYLNRIKKASTAFRKQWEQISSDLTALDHSDDQAIKSMGGNASAGAQKLMRESPLFHIYHLGSQEISHRILNAKDGFKGLSERSIQAIRVTLDGGLFREVQRLNRNIVFLTIGIAGGPYLGLLGTVIGVMITFAVIARSGEVEINSIAPGIAGALLATVAGLAVAIPALFAYSYLSARIKDSVGEMHNFIEEFLAKIAEFYPSKD